MSAVRVLVAENHLIVHELLVELITTTYHVIGVVRSSNDILPTAIEGKPDAIVMDISLPGRGGMQVLPEIRKEFPLVAVIVLTTYSHAVYKEEAKKLGADGFIDKVKAWRELNPAIRAGVDSRRQSPALLRNTVFNGVPC